MHVMTSEKSLGRVARSALPEQNDGLGPTTNIGSRLRALYGAIQDEGVPDQLLELLERLDDAELAQGRGARNED